jgi:acyl carrier protein
VTGTGRPDIAERLREYATLGRGPGGDELVLLELALFLEETFGIRLSDAEIAVGTLGSLERVERFVAAKLDGR